MTVLCKIVGPGKFIPGAATVFGIATLCFAFVHSFATAIPVRIILGIAEASVFPGIAFAMSRFYRGCASLVRRVCPLFTLLT